ncbi:MAG: UxaA family hydrolase [Deltaproteobacteria bacterium]|nr:UxaA family hydrolase [Deltaproteobacteria bacterium]MBW2418093.1 UxaA family hydrolase [Deltaproteobacteria bacterium]
MGFRGYRRSDGRVGVRNHVVVMSSVSCANGVVEAIGRELPEVKTVIHSEGCGRGPADVPATLRTLVGVARHPNVAATLVVGLGCEAIKAQIVAGQAAEGGRRIEVIGIQECGGTPKSVARGVEIAQGMLAEAATAEREEVGFEHLTLAMECGGSDSMSGITANPCVGRAADWLVERGGRVILSEITEFIGTEEIVAERCATPELSEQVLSELAGHRAWVKRELGPMANFVIAPGNSEGGLSSIAEKSLGCIEKGGRSPIREIVDYAESPGSKGLVIMKTPGSDIFSITGMIAGGAQLVLFTTGRGSPAGSPIAPVVKIASTTRLFESMPDDMDFDAGCIAAGSSLSEVGEELVGLVVEVAEGRATRAEINRCELFAIHTVGAAF